MSDAEECEPLQEHICSAAPAVIEDYKETKALNKELEVSLSYYSLAQFHSISHAVSLSPGQWGSLQDSS